MAHAYYRLGPAEYKKQCEQQFAVIDNLPKQDRALIREFGISVYLQAKKARCKKLSSMIDFCYEHRMRQHKARHPGIYPEPELLNIEIDI